MNLNSDYCVCRSCGERFTTSRNFDRHRIGKYDLHAPGYGRRCKTPAELTSSGLTKRPDGRWAQPYSALKAAPRSAGGRDAAGFGPDEPVCIH